MFENIVDYSTLLIESIGLAIILGGALISMMLFFKSFIKKDETGYICFRRRLGRSILLGLEFLVAGDIIDTIAVEPSVKSVVVLGMIVLIRTFLSFSIQVELEGKLPWKRKLD
jgi:uncharacterized membrane protein